MTFAQLYCGLIGLSLLADSFEHRRHILACRRRRSLKFFSISLPLLDETSFLRLQRLLLFSLICSVLSPNRFFFAFGAVGSLLYFSQVHALGSVRRKANTVPIVLSLLAIFPQPLAGRLIQLLLVQIYTSAGLQKIRHSGRKWLSGRVLQAYLYRNFLLTDWKPSLVLGKSLVWCRVLSLSALLFEMSFGLSVLLPSLAMGYLMSALLFHLGIYLFLRVNYLSYQGPALLALLNWSGA